MTTITRLALGGLDRLDIKLDQLLSDMIYEEALELAYGDHPPIEDMRVAERFLLGGCEFEDRMLPTLQWYAGLI